MHSFFYLLKEIFVRVNFCYYILIFDKSLENPFFYEKYFKNKVKKNNHPHLNPPPSRGRRDVGLEKDRFPLSRE